MQYLSIGNLRKQAFPIYDLERMNASKFFTAVPKTKFVAAFYCAMGVDLYV